MVVPQSIAFATGIAKLPAEVSHIQILVFMPS
jgi:hypothetical protein